jgi:hypothetical protein
MLPGAVISSGLDDACRCLYAYIDRARGPHGVWDIGGAQEIADDLSWQSTKVVAHGKHLASYGLIAMTRDGQKKYRFDLLHNPERGMVNPSARIPPSVPRVRKSSPFGEGRPHVPRASLDHTNDGQMSPRSTRPANGNGRSKYAVRYAGLVGEGQSDRVDAEMCGLLGCKEMIRGHSFDDHEPVLASMDDGTANCTRRVPRAESESGAAGDATWATSVILAAFPGAFLVAA